MLTVMGRGLSDLQRSILVLALRNRTERLERAPRDANYARGVWSIDLYDAEVLHHLYGWPLSNRGLGWRPRKEEQRPTFGQSFSMAEVGERRYRSAMSSLSRAVKRLEARGLVERRCAYLTGLDLTETGVKETEKLSPIHPTS